MEEPKSESDHDWEEVLADLPKHIREAGDTTANILADKTDVPLIDKLQAKGWLGRILVAGAVMALFGLLVVSCG